MAKRKPEGEYDVDVCEQLRRRIDSCGKTRYRVAKDAGVKPEIVARFCRDERGIVSETFSKLCRAVGLELTPKAD